MTNVHVAGVGMTPFSKALDSTLSGLASVAVDQALKDSTLTADRVGMVFFGNAMGGTMTGQEMIRAKAGLGRTDFAALGTPMVAVENACASSSTAVPLASMAVASGQVDIALAVGAEKMTSPDKTLAFKGLASAVDLERVDELEESLYGGRPENAAGVAVHGHLRRHGPSLHRTLRRHAGGLRACGRQGTPPRRSQPARAVSQSDLG